VQVLQVGLVALGGVRVELDGHALISLFGEGVASLVEDHRFIVFLLEEFVEVDFLV
jgi:hypothetical protein